jgi:protein gp37
MGANTKIEWCDHTFNPWIGCTKVSPACAHCYAENETPVRVLREKGRETWGKGAPRHRTGRDTWRAPRRWNRKANDRTCSNGHAYPSTYANLAHGKCYSCGERWENMPWHRPRVFCASLADWLDPEVPAAWLADLLELIRSTPNLDWLLLTKRPELWMRRLGAARPAFCDDAPLHDFISSWVSGRAPDNVWIGTTVEDQARADERIPALLKIPARVRFLSCEPLLGPVDLTAVKQEVAPGFFGDCLQWYHRGYSHEFNRTPFPTISWVICGGESGTKARPMHPNWARSLRNQCAAAGVPFFFKQWGTWAPHFAEEHETHGCDDGCRLVCPETGELSEEAPAEGEHEFMWPHRSKHTSGRLLDGVEHKAFPEVRR